MKTERASKAGVPRRGTRVGDKKLSEPVTLFAAIEAEQHEALRAIAFSERRSLADVGDVQRPTGVAREDVGTPQLARGPLLSKRVLDHREHLDED